MAKVAHRPAIFTPAEDAMIKARYLGTTAAILGRQLGKSAKQVRNRACYLGVVKQINPVVGRYDHRALDAALNTLRKE